MKTVDREARAIFEGNPLLLKEAFNLTRKLRPATERPCSIGGRG